MDGLDLETVDYFRSDDLIGDPYPYYEHLRAQCPVHREPNHGVYMVSGYEEIVAVEADTAVFSACNNVSGPFPGFPVPLVGDDVTEIIEQYRDQLPMSRNILTADPPRHTALRSLVIRHLSPKRLAEITPFMERTADRLIDEFADHGELEMIRDFAGPFALTNICEILGVPESDHEAFREELMGPRRVRGVGSTSAPMPAEPFAFVHDRIRGYLEDCRANPRDDVLTSVATTAYPDGTMPDLEDVVQLASTLFVAGTGTTASMLASGVRFLADVPELQQRLRDEPELIPNFLEETLRFDGTCKTDFRLSRVPASVAGAEIPAGSHVALLFLAANRDPRKFDDPNEFHFDRPNARQHLTFGHGIHTCTGAPLARLEGRVGMHRLLDRLGGITLSDEVHGPAGARQFEFTSTYVLRHLERLHVEFTPRG